ncbi:DUF6426 family protein [Kitasatospora sp. NPDC051853]|uniref:DUF6426 family protein n=1 Tax=Kitasatospora sp. NPDC051853 TaxID=3364058 RepID=UPI0037940B7C
MKFRASLAAVALGATLFATVPAVVAPNLALAAGDCGPDYWPDSWYEGSCYSSYSQKISWSSGEIGDTYDMGRVVVVGKRQWVSRPEAPIAVPGGGNPGTGGGGGSSSGSGIKAVWSGAKWIVPHDCLVNESPAPQKFTQQSTYNVSFEASQNTSLEALKVLEVSLGTKINSSISRSTNWEITIAPGQRFALGVEYQTTTYMVSTGLSTYQLVNVSAPTATIAGVPC